MANDSNDPVVLPPTIWIALIAALAGAFALHQQVFQDARPTDSPPPLYRHIPSDDQDVEARLWEDPLAAVAIARGNRDGAATQSAAAADAASNGTAHTAQHGLGCKGDCARLPPRHTIARLRTTLTAYVAQKSPVLVLAALVPGAPYAEDVETRRRTRYAVLAGLYRADYIPVNNEHVGYVRLGEFYPATAQAHDVAAFEWFQPDHPVNHEPAPQVLLLWLDQDGFRDSPLGRISRIVNSMVSASACTPALPSEVATMILGPADSDGLRAMSEELKQETDEECDAPKKALRPMSIYSSRATASDSNVLGETLEKGETLAGRFKKLSDGVRLYRSVATDDLLAKGLSAELGYRGVQDPGEIALIAERDTLYARQMGEYFGGCEVAGTFDEPGTDRAGQKHPLCFTYLRGLDGLAPPPPVTDGSSAPATDSSLALPQTNPPPVASELATGQGQLDYLRRLAASLASRAVGPGNRRHSIKAIGILGSDVYDKLLVLQALRRSYPSATFFTTDLDARLLDQQSLPWTRQLIVASSLGLALRPCLQQGIPPFRDIYQTATYFSTVLALHQFLSSLASSAAKGTAVAASADRCSAEDPRVDAQRAAIEDGNAAALPGLQWTLKPRVFEIGRKQVFDLSVDADAKAACNFDGLCRSIAAAKSATLLNDPARRVGFEVGLALAILAIAVAWAAIGTRSLVDLTLARQPLTSGKPSPQIRRALALATLLGVVLLSVALWPLLVATLTHNNTRMPPSVFGGASLWAASLVEILSILAVVALVIRGQRKLGESADEMQATFEFPNSRDVLVKDRARQVRAWPLANRLMEIFWFPIGRLSIDKGPLAVTPHISEVEALLARYLYRGTAGARCLRAVLATIIATAVLLTLELKLGRSLVGAADVFTTGSKESRITLSVSLLSLVSMLFLIFWVADAMLLTRSFILELLRLKPKWPADVVLKTESELMLPADEAVLWLDLQLISARTTWVAALIWYPSIVILVMTLAALSVEFGQFGFANNPLALIIGAAMVVIAAVLLRQAAESWRSSVTETLEDARLRDLGRSAPLVTAATQLDRLLERVGDLSDGAFAPFSAQPFVRAVLIPLLTYGATAVLGYLHIGS
jgi:membrane protein implicated in regulation of membrane protease activity